MDNKIDTVNLLFKETTEFLNMAPNLLHNKTTDGFIAWFEKLKRKNASELYLYLCAHCDELTEEELKIATKSLRKPIKKEYGIKKEG